MISKTDIDKIKKGIDPLEIYSRYMSLKRTGNNYFACCPFHGEKTASLSISIRRNFVFKCFGCSTGSDFIGFYQKIEGISFTDACIKLADEFNIDIEIDENIKKSISIKKILSKINYHTMSYYRSNLAYAPTAYEYLIDERGISSDIIKQFKIGCTSSVSYSDSFNKYRKLTNVLGLTIEKNDKVYDFFNGKRLIIPFEDEYNNVLGFNSRALDDSVKYINSKESVLFDKKNVLFGINHAIKEIKLRKSVIIVEGIF
ncbi:MAG: hypothetical protein GQ557_01900, partial [Mycoplasmataceae bacterium]|nr:hypothetical protein [Mycoplasmataceae bacterium]